MMINRLQGENKKKAFDFSFSYCPLKFGYHNFVSEISQKVLRLEA